MILPLIPSALLLAAAAFVPAAPIVKVPITPYVTAPVPRLPLDALFSPTDYPTQSKAKGEQGRTDVTLIIGPNGRVVDCTVRSSSGSSLLDYATCRVLQMRARFDPPRDRDGNATVAAIEFSKEWLLTRESS